jgi:hypothetical protein
MEGHAASSQFLSPRASPWTEVRVEASDSDGRQQIARYMIRVPCPWIRPSTRPSWGATVYCSKLHLTLKRSCHVMPSPKRVSPVGALPPVGCPLRVERSLSVSTYIAVA